MLAAAGQRAVAAGQRRHPAAGGGAAPAAVRRASRWSCPASSCTGPRSLRPLASACLNVAPDHLDWHGSLDAYTRDKGRVYRNTEVACVYNVADPVTEQLVRDADVIEGCRAVGFTLGVPAPVDARRGRRRAVSTGPSSRSGPPPRPSSGTLDGRPARLRRGARAAPRRQRARGGGPGPRLRRARRGGPGRAARLPPAAAPDRAGGRARRRRPGWTTPRPPTRTPPRRRCRPSTRWCGSPAGWPRVPDSTTWSPSTAGGCAAAC